MTCESSFMDTDPSYIAFDSINHDRIIRKFYRTIFMPIQLLENYLKSRTQQVILNNNKSEKTELTQGVPQGTVLGTPFSTQYVDDTFNFTSNKNLKIALEYLENNISTLTYFEQNFLQVNKSKTEFIVFETSKNRWQNARVIAAYLNITG